MGPGGGAQSGEKSKTGASALTASGIEGRLGAFQNPLITRTLAFAAGIKLHKLGALCPFRIIILLVKLYNVAQHRRSVLPRSDAPVPDVIVWNDLEESEGLPGVEEITGVDADCADV
ncbi:hypothetical protein C8J56DRAFT_1054224 [Mycena floridula]|nr:hypothetical protein C8J56DRAFT_1054224 [Mycena floridula]